MVAYEEDADRRVNTANPIRILVVDDHLLLREGIAALIGGQPDMMLVVECSNGREAIQQFRTHRPDVTLMDLQMPEMSGLDALVAIRGEFPEARIIVLTTYSGDVQVVRALQAGARAYLPTIVKMVWFRPEARGTTRGDNPGHRFVGCSHDA
jgi:DNA-binding NarL/FixJ family response regulator